MRIQTRLCKYTQWYGDTLYKYNEDIKVHDTCV